MKQVLKAVMEQDVSTLKACILEDATILHQIIAKANKGKSEVEALYKATGSLLELIKNDRALLERVLNAPDKSGVAPITKALESNQVGMVSILLQYPQVQITEGNWAAISNLPNSKETEIHKRMLRYKAELITRSAGNMSFEEFDKLLDGDSDPLKYCSRGTLESLKRGMKREHPLLADFLITNLSKLVEFKSVLSRIRFANEILLKNKREPLLKVAVSEAISMINEGLWLNATLDQIINILELDNEALNNALQKQYGEVTSINLGSALIEVLAVGYKSYVEPLIDAGADVNIIDGEGYTPLMWAVINENSEAIKQLIDAGAWLNERIIEFAIRVDNTEAANVLMDALLESGVQGNERTLQLAVRINNAEAVRRLLFSGVDPHRAAIIEVEGRKLVPIKSSDEVKAVVNQYLKLERDFRANFESKIRVALERHEITLDNIEAKIDAIIEDQPEMQVFANKSKKANMEQIHRYLELEGNFKRNFETEIIKGVKHQDITIDNVEAKVEEIIGDNYEMKGFAMKAALGKMFEDRVIEGIKSSKITLQNVEDQVDEIIGKDKPKDMRDFIIGMAEEMIHAIPKVAEKQAKPKVVDDKEPKVRSLSFFQELLLLIKRHLFKFKNPNSEQEFKVNKATEKLSKEIEQQPGYQRLSGQIRDKFASGVGVRDKQDNGVPSIR
jgi:hypothetical protein